MNEQAGQLADAPGGTAGFGLAEAVALAVTVVWLATAAAVLWGLREGDGPLRLLALGASVLSLVPVWAAVVLLRTARALRAEAARLQGALDALRQADQARRQSEPRAAPAAQPGAQIERRLDALLAAQTRAEAALAQVMEAQSSGAASPRAPPPREGLAEAPAAFEARSPASTPDAQPALALAAPAGGTPVGLDDFLRALHFPDTVEDAEGFRALRASLADPRAARIIRAAQDVLTLISEDGIYMDDLAADQARPELWRRFARGERGGAMADLGGVRDPAAVARATTRLREDAVFRDVAHHFLRHFDRMLEALEPDLTDADIARLSRTRSACAFMMLGRATGMFG